jgi:N-acetylmuramoyl-L-alanine amidase
MKKLTILVSIISFLLVLPIVHAEPSIKGLRISGTANQLRLVFDLTERVKHRVFTLENPKRLVVDLEGAGFQNAIPAIPTDASFVREIRSGSPDEGSMRVVLDLNEAVRNKDFWLPPTLEADHRLVLDLERLERTVNTAPRVSHNASVNTTPHRTNTPSYTNNIPRVARHSSSENRSFAEMLHDDESVTPRSTTSAARRRVVTDRVSGIGTSNSVADSRTSTRLRSSQASYRPRVPNSAVARPQIATRTSYNPRMPNNVTASRTVTRPLVTTRTSPRSRLQNNVVASQARSTLDGNFRHQEQRSVAVRATTRQQPMERHESRIRRAQASTKTAAAARLAVGTSAWPNLRSVRGRDLVIVVDAGHGGKDSGAVGRRGTKEKDIVLSIARRLARLIDMQPGMRAVLTRSNDTFISLRGRVRKARRARADLFISIHADAAYNRQAQGGSIYVLSERGASSAAARTVAARENASDLVGGVAIDRGPLLARVLVDMSLSATMEASRQAAWSVLRQMYQVERIHKNSVQYAGFAVLKAPDIPSMLVETAFISNAEEEMMLRTAAYQEQIAGAVFSGIQEFFRSSPPAGTRIAQAMRSYSGQ